MAPESCCPDSQKENLNQLIDAVNLTDLQKRFLKSRWLDQLMWMESSAKKAQMRYYLLRLMCIIGGVMIPALVGLDMDDKMNEFIRWMTVLLSLMVAVSAAVEAFFQFGERWRHYRRTAELLKIEGWRFFQLCGPYQNADSHEAAYPVFAGRVEETFQGEVEDYIARVVREKGKNGDNAGS